MFNKKKESIICPGCNHKNQKDAKFCSNCGSRFSEEIKEPAKEESTEEFYTIPDWVKNPYFIGMIIVLIISAIIRIKYLFVDSIWNDETVYMWSALKLFNPTSPEVISRFIYNFTPLSILKIFSLFTDIFTAGRLMGLFFGILGIIAVYLLGKEVRNRFTGLSAAILLTTHHLHWFIGSKALLDIPITTMFTIFLLFFVRLLKKPSKKNIIYFIIVSILTFFTKGGKQSVLIFSTLGLFALIYFTPRLMGYKKQLTTLLGNHKVLFSTILLIISLFIILLLTNKVPNILINLTLKRITSVFMQTQSQGTLFYYFENLPFLIKTYNIPFFIIGLLFMIYYRKKEDLVLLSFLIVMFVSFSIHPLKIPRQLLPAIPIIFITIGICFDEIFEITKQFVKFRLFRLFLIIIIVVLAIPFYQEGVALHISKSYTYSGLKEAGEWIKDNTNQEAVIYASSSRVIRLFGDKEYAQYGGSLNNFPSDFEDFKQEIESTDKIIIQLDMWEYTAPDYVYPLDNEKLNQMVSLGFTPIKQITRPIQTREGLQEVPVVFILEK